MKKEVSYETLDWFAIALPNSDFRSGGSCFGASWEDIGNDDCSRGGRS